MQLPIHVALPSRDLAVRLSYDHSMDWPLAEVNSTHGSFNEKVDARVSSNDVVVLEQPLLAPLPPYLTIS